ncbi:MAG TPA: VOC family protein, partial [Methylibium sp.]
MSYLPGKFVWFEHVSAEPTKARAFYEPLFGWHVERMPMGQASYDMILCGQDGIGGIPPAQAGARAHWISYLSVPDVDKAHAKALAAGAKSLQAPTDFAPVGRGAKLSDPTGAAFWVWKSADGDRADAEQAIPGSWAWNELMTQDAKTALAFYEKAFGFTHDTMDMGEQGKYYILKSADGKGRAGLAQASDPKAPAAWMPYVHVADCD